MIFYQINTQKLRDVKKNEEPIKINRTAKQIQESYVNTDQTPTGI